MLHGECRHGSGRLEAAVNRGPVGLADRHGIVLHELLLEEVLQQFLVKLAVWVVGDATMTD